MASLLQQTRIECLVHIFQYFVYMGSQNLVLRKCKNCGRGQLAIASYGQLIWRGEKAT